MLEEEEKVYNFIKLTILFLITMLGLCLTSDMFVAVLLLFYIAFMKD